MKNWIRWLFPMLTIFSILIAILLPQQFSLFQDQALYNIVHTEELKTENIFSVQESEQDLTKQIYLLLDWLGYTDANAPIMIEREVNETESTPEERKEMTELLSSGLKKLKENGLIQKDSFIESKAGGRWFYLQNQKEDTGNWFLSLELYDINIDAFLWMVLDKESGKILFISITNFKLKQEKTVKEIGNLLLDQIGLDYQLVYEEKNIAVFSLIDTMLRYDVFYDGTIMQFFPQILIDKIKE